MQIAIASTDGIHVDQHFGKAIQFHIFKVTPEAFNLVVVRHTDGAYSSGEKDHTFNPERFAKVTASLLDCQKVFITKIGEAPAAALKDIGIEPIEYEGKISHINL